MNRAFDAIGIGGAAEAHPAPKAGLDRSKLASFLAFANQNLNLFLKKLPFLQK